MTMSSKGGFGHSMFQRIGWANFYQMPPPTIRPLALEFLSSPKVQLVNGDDTDPGCISFRQCNHEVEMTLAVLNWACGFPENGSRYVPQTFQKHTLWKEISGEFHFSKRNARASSISNPCIQYVHHVITHTIFRC